LASAASVSLVEVSPSTVTRLKLASAARRSAVWQCRFADRGISGDEREQRRYGMDHPRAFRYSGDVTRCR